MCLFKRSRSDFWLSIRECEGNINFYASTTTCRILDFHFPDMRRFSNASSWQPTQNPRIHQLWIPPDRSGGVDLTKIKHWAGFACQCYVWLGIGQLQTFFRGDELEYCIAGDFNFTIDNNARERTELGRAEYRLKYHASELTETERDHCWGALAQSMIDTFDLLPFTGPYTGPEPIITSIPAHSTSSTLGSDLARELASDRELSYFPVQLLVAKPQMKNISLAERVSAWSGIYESTNTIECDLPVIAERDVVIVDDLYQSGASMWCYAKWLREQGARSVFGLACVKSMSSTDNQWNQ